MLKLIISFGFVLLTGAVAFFTISNARSLMHPTWTAAPASMMHPAATTRVSPPAAITQLTHDPGMALRPTWSPDDRLIAFDSTREGPSHIYVMNADGSNVRALTVGISDDRHPVWSHDGGSIVYDSVDGTHQEIWSVNVASGKRTQLTHADGLADFAAPSPDGTRIVYYVYKDFKLEIWSARSDGSDARALTNGLASARKNQPTMAWHHPGWSPDNGWITYTGGDGKSIWVMREDGSNAADIIDDGETNHFPWFADDGRLAFITEYVPPRYGASWTNAWAYNMQTSERSLLLEHMSMQGPMDISADYSKVLFSSPRGGHFDVYAINLSVPGGLRELQGTLADVLAPRVVTVDGRD
jgi:Tol biopolymer transport system component